LNCLPGGGSISSHTTLYFVLARRLAAPANPPGAILDLDDKAAAAFPILAGLASFVSVATRSFGTVSDGALSAGHLYDRPTGALGSRHAAVAGGDPSHGAGQAGLPGRTPGRRVYFTWARQLAPLLWLLIAIGLGALFAGYVALANYISQAGIRNRHLVDVLFLLHH